MLQTKWLWATSQLCPKTGVWQVGFTKPLVRIFGLDQIEPLELSLDGLGEKLVELGLVLE